MLCLLRYSTTVFLNLISGNHKLLQFKAVTSQKPDPLFLGSYGDIHVQKLVQKYMPIRTNTWMFLTFVSFLKTDSL